MMAAPMAAKVMTSAMICRWREPRSSASASPPPTPSSSPVFDGVGLSGPFVGADDPHDDEQAHHHDAGADQQHRLRAEGLDQAGRDGRSGGAAQARAAADQPEQALGLARVVDVVGERPELADEQNAEDQSEQVETDRHPFGADLREEHPEEHQQHDHAGLGDRDGPAPRHRGDELRVGLHQQADHHAGPELHPRQVVGAQARDELRARDRLDDVVGRHRQERVEEEQQRSAALAGAQFGDRRQPAGEQGRTRSLVVAMEVDESYAGADPAAIRYVVDAEGGRPDSGTERTRVAPVLAALRSTCS